MRNFRTENEVELFFVRKNKQSRRPPVRGEHREKTVANSYDGIGRATEIKKRRLPTFSASIQCMGVDDNEGKSVPAVKARKEGCLKTKRKLKPHTLFPLKHLEIPRPSFLA